MTQADWWYRQEEWSEKSRDEFWSRLNRGKSKRLQAQRVCIQASTLRRSGQPREALDLLSDFFQRFPESPQHALAHSIRAQCLESLGSEPAVVLNALKLGLEAERNGGAQTSLWIDYGWFVLQSGKTELYEPALEIAVEGAKTKCLFPIDRYKLCALRAFVEEARGRLGAAREQARCALQELGAGSSGFPSHPSLGLVPEDVGFRDRLERLAASQNR